MIGRMKINTGLRKNSLQVNQKKELNQLGFKGAKIIYANNPDTVAYLSKKNTKIGKEQLERLAEDLPDNQTLYLNKHGDGLTLLRALNVVEVPHLGVSRKLEVAVQQMRNNLGLYD